MNQSFKHCDCGVLGTVRDNRGELVVIEVGDNTVATVQATIVSGTRTSWIASVRRSNAPGGPFYAFDVAVTLSASGISSKLPLEGVKYLAMYNDAIDAGLLVDFNIDLAKPGFASGL